MRVCLDFNNFLFVFFTFYLLIEQIHGVTIDDSNFLDVTKHWCRNSNDVEYIYGPISTWNVSQVTSFRGAFSLPYSRCQYDLTDEVDFSQWDVKNVTDMSYTFASVKFNPIVSNWDVSRVRDMSGMFFMADKFSQDLSAWNVSSVIEMAVMFDSAKIFDSDLSNWDVSNVKKMNRMFHQAESFNSDLSKWNVSQVTHFSNMFSWAYKFNSDISKWDVSSGLYFDFMFTVALSFSQSLCWDNWRFNKSTSDIFECTNCSNNDCGELSCSDCHKYPFSATNMPMHFLQLGTAILTIFWCISMM